MCACAVEAIDVSFFQSFSPFLCSVVLYACDFSSTFQMDIKGGVTNFRRRILSVDINQVTDRYTICTYMTVHYALATQVHWVYTYVHV